MPKRKTIIEAQAEFPDVLVLKYEGSEAITVLGTCGHVWTAQAGHLRKGQRCNRCHVSAPRSVREYQAEFDDLLVVKVEDSRNVTVLGTCSHVWVAAAASLRKGKRCGQCSPSAPKSLLVYQAEFDDLLVLKAEGALAVTVKYECTHVAKTTAANLRKGQRCGRCANYGYKTDKAGFLYFMERPGEMQIGITNVPDQRLATHAREGW